jgi:hypothetical protein
MALLRAAAGHPFLCRCGWMSILLIAASLKLIAQPTIPPEYQLKAVFLFNFARFVDWPARAFSAPDAPLVIGILGDDPFGGYLDETVRGEKSNDHPLVVQRYRRPSEIHGCHVLFISRSEADRLEQIFSTVRGRAFLTVGELDDFTARGGMIRLANERNKIRIHVNMSAVKTANLALSAKLLGVATIEP